MLPCLIMSPLVYQKRGYVIALVIMNLVLLTMLLIYLNASEVDQLEILSFFKKKRFIVNIF